MNFNHSSRNFLSRKNNCVLRLFKMILVASNEVDGENIYTILQRFTYFSEQRFYVFFLDFYYKKRAKFVLDSLMCCYAFFCAVGRFFHDSRIFFFLKKKKKTFSTPSHPTTWLLCLLLVHYLSS